MAFLYADQQKDFFEEKLSEVFGREVEIRALDTRLVGFTPSMSIKGFRVSSDIEGESALSLDRAIVMLSPISLLTLQPKFSEFVVTRPSLEVVTLPDNQLQVAGITLVSSRQPGIDRKRLVSWLLEQESAAWHQGDIRWRKTDGTVQRYSDISFVYQKDQDKRLAKGAITAPKGALGAELVVDGNPLSSQDWDASVELIGGDAQQWIKPGDLSFSVEDGMGSFKLAHLNLDLIRDLLSLSGLAEKTRWILDAKLAGVLHDVSFDFTGALLDLKDWSLVASATNVAYKSLDTLPALNNLNGELKASANRGSFNFSAVDSVFDWSSLYDSSFPIKQAEGKITWEIQEDETFLLSLHRAKLTDPNLSIYDLNVDVSFESQSKKVSNFGGLFKVDSLDSLKYEDGEMVVAQTSSAAKKAANIDASVKFEVGDMSALSAYLPNIKKLQPLQNWLSIAYKQGVLTNGRASYRGRLSPGAMQSGEAKLRISADFDDVIVDYAPVQGWPEATQGKGSSTLENDFLTVIPEQLWLNGDRVTDGLLTLENLFSPDILLKVKGKTTTSLEKGMAFVFQGPLIAKQNRPEVLPVTPTGGEVDIDVDLHLPLRKTKNLKINGTSTIRDGSVMLTEGVPLTNINTIVEFTEKRISSDDIEARFLGGATNATLITTEETTPPKMRLIGSGVSQLDKLTPWVGEHLLTCFSGLAQWQGTVDFDGNNVVVNSQSDLLGVEVIAPAPLAKSADKPANFKFFMDLGGKKVNGTSSLQRLTLEMGDLLRARFQARALPSEGRTVSLFDHALIELGTFDTADSELLSKFEGVHIEIEYPELDIDEIVESVIDLASFEPKVLSQNTDFLDALRSVSIKTPISHSLGREFGELNVTAKSADGWAWFGQLNGDNISGALTMRPREEIGFYQFDLEKLIVGPESGDPAPLEAIDKTLKPFEYPEFKLSIEALKMDGRDLGALEFHGRPNDTFWNVEKFALVHNGIRTTATGGWSNQVEQGSVSSFDVVTSIDEAEGVLEDMDFQGYVKKGSGSLNSNIEWAGAPHEFDYSRLDGKFDLFVKDGELVQVEPGSGKLLGLLNFNAIARRLVFDFRDLFASGLQFDRMRYSGLLSNGEAILQDAYILTPAVFVRMEGKLDLAEELIDMDVHISPELGGNLTLLSALANPTAGAVVFLTSQLFKDDMRRASFASYQAKGTWEDFEMVEIDSEGKPIDGDTADPQ